MLKIKTFLKLSLLGKVIILCMSCNNEADQEKEKKTDNLSFVVNGDVLFKPNTTPQERLQSVFKIQKDLLDSLTVSYGDDIKKLTINLSFRSIGDTADFQKFRFALSLKNGVAADSVITTPKPRPPGPKLVYLPAPVQSVSFIEQ